MSRPAERIGPGAIAEAWSRLRVHLHARCRVLNDEVSRYPTPIARCDEQLTALLEQRSRAARHRRFADAADEAVRNAPAADRVEALTGFLRKTADATDDASERALRRSLEDALAPQSGS